MVDEKKTIELAPNRLDEKATHRGGSGRPFRLKVAESVKWKHGKGKVGGFELTPSHAGGYWGPYGWFEHRAYAEWFARASNALVLIKDPEQFLLDAIDIVMGAGTQEQHARMALQICRECRSPICESDQRAHGAQPGLCSSCRFWGERLAGRSALTVIVAGGHYTIGSPQYQEPPPPSPYGGYGFGGARWEILFKDGRREVTHNLWSQGAIPARLRALPEWHDNACFVPTQLDRFKAELATAAGIDLAAAPGTCAHGENCHGDGKAEVFTDEASAAEYQITGLCQACQDVVFAEPPDEPSEVDAPAS